MGSRRASAAILATSATIAGAVGCHLISGASDLEVDPLFGLEPAAGLEGGVLVDAALPPRLDGGVDGPSNPDASDAALDGTVDGGTRFRTVTLEGGSLTGAFGFDSVSGQTNLAAAGQALDGSFSLRADKDAFGRIDFPDKAEVYATALVRFENIGLNTSIVMSFDSIPFTAGVDVACDDNVGLQLLIGGDRVATGGPKLLQGVTYRIGLHVKQGGAGAALVEVFVAAQGLPFGQAAMRSTSRALGTMRSLSVGSINGNARTLIDDVFVDSAAMPGP